jgi:hypothetical protein
VGVGCRQTSRVAEEKMPLLIQRRLSFEMLNIQISFQRTVTIRIEALGNHSSRFPPHEPAPHPSLTRFREGVRPTDEGETRLSDLRFQSHLKSKCVPTSQGG